MKPRSQEPVGSLPYDSESVLLRTEPGIELAGTITLPREASSAPAVLLVPGSGAQDRDEQLCGHKPFLVLADHLTRSGIVVLRLDDRGVGSSSGKKDQCTYDNLLIDIRAALDYLASRNEVDPSFIGILGHSEGGILAAAAAYYHLASFSILLACPAALGEDTIHQQAALISELSGATTQQVSHERRMNEAVFAILRQPLSNDSIRADVQSVIATYLRTWPHEGDHDGSFEVHARDMAHAVLAPAFRAFLTCDPRTYLSGIDTPVLALFAELDVQVPPAIHMHLLRTALTSRGNSFVTVEEFAGLNHLFQTATTGSISDYESIEETISPRVLTRISDWVQSIFRSAVQSN